MALELSRTVNLSGRSVITVEENGRIVSKDVESFTATINSTDPNDISFGGHQLNKTLRKENRAQCLKDKAEFDDVAYAIQDEMLAAMNAEEE